MSRAMVAAGMKDKAARGMRERSQMKRIGSALFKIWCVNCGSLHLYEMFEPGRHGFRYWCWTCGAKDGHAKRPPQPKPLTKKELVLIAERDAEARIAVKVARINELLARARS